MFSGLNLPTLPSLSSVAVSSEYSLTSVVKSSPALALPATSSARFFASSLDRLTVAGAFLAPLYATSTCCAVIHSGFAAVSAGLSWAETAGVGAGAAAVAATDAGALASGTALDVVFAGAAGGSSQPSMNTKGVQIRRVAKRNMSRFVARAQ